MVASLLKQLITEIFEEEVVGTLYWMGPEIIELRNITPACDVWPLAATTDFDTDSMPSMFQP